MFIKTGQMVYSAEGGAPAPTSAPAPAPPSAHPVSAPWAEAQGVWNVGEGEAAQPWYATIPEPEARAHVESKQYANPAELALANYNLTKMQRGADDVIALPGKDAAPEQVKEFYSKLGVPENPAGYEFKFGEGVEVDDGMMEFGRNTFHKANLTPEQAQIVADNWNEFIGTQGAAALGADTAANNAALDALSASWGADLEANKAAGQRAVQALGLSNEAVERIEGAVGSAAVVELLASIGRKSDEGGFVAGGVQMNPNNPATMSKDQAAARIMELQGDADFQKKYTDKSHPGHKEALTLMEQLFAKSA